MSLPLVRLLAPGVFAAVLVTPLPASAQHVICCNLLVDVGGDWVGAWRSCNLGAAPPERLPALCEQVAGCSSAAAYCGVSDPCTVGGSIVDVANQALGETIRVAGTPFRLGYRSDRAGDPYANDIAGWSLDVHHAYDAQGRLFYHGDGRRRVAWMPSPGKRPEVVVPSEDGRWVHSFVTESGRHIRTIDAVTGALLYRFGYDKAGKLTSVEDAYANIARLERDAKGAPAAIVAPGGERTTLALDAAGLLSAVTGPGGEKTSLAYDRGGRLTTLTDPRGHVHRYTYTSAGRLQKDENPAGGGWSLAATRVGKASKVTLTSAGGRMATHTVERSPNGDEHREHRRSDGTAARLDRAADGTRRTVYPDGAVQTVVPQPDPRSPNARIPRNVTYATPGGRKLKAVFERGADGGHPGVDATETVTINGATFASRFDSERGEWTWTTPAGRTLAVTFDDQGRVTTARPGGGAPRRFTYDESGRVTAVTAGAGAEARTLGVTWGEGGVVVLQDALRRSVRAELDSVGRVVREVGPDGRETRYVRNPEGFVEQIVPPDGRAHRFEYSPADLVAAYLPPDGPAERYAYDRDGLLTSMTVGNVKALAIEYDSAGRRSVVTTPHSTTRYQYDAATGHLRAVSTADGAVAYERDGPLVTAISWTGLVRGRVRRGYDDGLRLASVAVDGASGYATTYDTDGLVVRAGDLVVERDRATGAVSSTTLGVVTTRHVRNAFGELTRIEAAASGRPLLTLAYERDAGGRIVGRTETTPAGRREFRYAYDPAGRLSEVLVDGSRAASFAYGADGNRVGAVADARKLDHDALGVLRKATATGGRPVEYVVDGVGRRIGRKVGGRMAEGLLYLDALRPVARVDATGAVTALFVHATRANVPDAMIANGATYRLVSDLLGSPRLVVDTGTGKVVQEIEYDAFGVVTRDSQPGFQPFGFAGGLYDPETKLVHLGARDYDPAAGRWTSRDPLGFAGGTTNLTEYVGSDPVNRVDPWGLQEDDPEWQGPVMDPGHPSVVFDSGGNVIFTGPDFSPGSAIDRPVVDGPSPGPTRIDWIVDKAKNGVPLFGAGTVKGGSLDRDRFDRGDTPGLCTDTWTGQTGGQNRYTPEPEGAKGIKLDWRF